MKAMIIAFAAIVILAVGSNAILKNAGFSTQDVTSSADVRLD